MPRFNGDIRLDGNLVFPSGAENTTAIRAFLNESGTGMPGSGQIRFVREGNEEGYWYLFNHPTEGIYDFDAGALPSGRRIATFDDVNTLAQHSTLNDQVGDLTLRGLSGVTVKVDTANIIDIHVSGLDVVAGNGVIVSEEDPSADGSRVWRVSANQTHLEGWLSEGSYASGLVKLTSPSGSIQARTVGGEVQLDVDYDVIQSGLQQPASFTQGFTDETQVVVTHSFGQSGVMVVVYDDAAKVILPHEVTITDANNVTVDFNTAQTGTIVVLR
jgi:hypothetical protein